MKATRFSLTFIALALCGSGHAGPCKPKSSSTAIDGTTSTEATLSASTEISTATSIAESSTTDLSSIISESLTSTATATSDSQIPTSSMTTEPVTATTSATELSSSVETLTTTNTAEATTSDAPTTTTTTEESTPSELFLNPSFNEPNADGDFDGSPWTLGDAVSPVSVSIKSDLAHTGFHSAYWSITNTAQNGYIEQTVTLEQRQLYSLTYWWYIDEDQQPQNFQDCYIGVEQRSVDDSGAYFPDFLQLETPLPLKTWTKQDITFNSETISPAVMRLSIRCLTNAGSGLRIAIDDIHLSKKA
ncbi:hypothetical protein RAB80_003700 [Fusarium oxysporum f. sp. vasinfectum]|uniref:CBM-cenC domain-containing protein n=1 Tax=Fusarium oxysporum f. sp. vasinfectum 25433 TaxID=1089449 RepID=X0MIC6_FUSOX|nr:hypothetical protein FOTG_11677 [Fusarium oxysporum f. sp. vasinfectum 25433]KAK2681907.1 hypothetical protein RAB80_003700 [Fusarium oxysporum f. sp. vasinfectum]KAK2933661.1 hypothetical protein FoTM2_004905 [Fusarium oxysporum f. sp. vasinfectum]